MRYASMTPAAPSRVEPRHLGIMGRDVSIPNWSHTNIASSCDSAMFFGVSGSIAGGTMFTLPFIPAGT